MDDLASTELLDCHGHTSHTLTSLVDGTVRIRFAAGHEARVDPHRRSNLTPHITVVDSLMDIAASLRPL